MEEEEQDECEGESVLSSCKKSTVLCLLYLLVPQLLITLWKTRVFFSVNDSELLVLAPLVLRPERKKIADLHGEDTQSLVNHTFILRT